MSCLRAASIWSGANASYSSRCTRSFILKFSLRFDVLLCPKKSCSLAKRTCEYDHNLRERKKKIEGKREYTFSWSRPLCYWSAISSRWQSPGCVGPFILLVTGVPKTSPLGGEGVNISAEDWAVAREEDEAIRRPVFSEWLKTGIEPMDTSRELALQRFGCNVKAASMPHGEMVNPQA